MTAAVNSQHYTMKLEGVEKSILSFMNQERKSNGPNSCEVILLANNMKHYAHKIVLTSFSDFFRKYFHGNSAKNETNGENKSDDDIDLRETSEKAHHDRAFNKIHLPGINSDELEPILEYMYTSTLELKAENVNEILLVACLLQVTSVIEFCAEVLCKQPDWKSPLVSSRILNYVRHDGNLKKDAECLSPTAVTWAMIGGRPSCQETKPRRRGRLITNGWTNKNETRRSGVPRRRREIRMDREEEHHHVAKKKFPTNGVVSTGSGTPSNKYPYHPGYLEENHVFDYPLTIDYEDLDRRMPQIQAGKMSSIFQPQDSSSLASRQLESHERRLPKEKSNIGWETHPKSVSAKHPIALYSSPHLETDIYRNLRARSSEDLQSSMIPQLIDYRSIWQAAQQATALNLPIYPSNYSNLRSAQHLNSSYSKAAPIDGGVHRDVDGYATTNHPDGCSFQQNAGRTLTTILSRPSPRSITVSERNLNDRYRIHGVDYKADISRAPFKQNSIDEVLSGTQDSPINLSCSLHAPASNGMLKHHSHHSKSTYSDNVVEQAHQITGRIDFTNSKYSCFRKPSKSGKEQSESLISTQGSGSHIDYHKRKRKLLLGAQDQAVDGTNWPKVTKQVENKDGNRLPARKQQCSSEDGILAKEYTKYHMDNTSDFDSDDSGRPSSV